MYDTVDVIFLDRFVTVRPIRFLYMDIRALFFKANRKQQEMKQDTNTTKIQLVVEIWKVHVDIARISLEFLPKDEALIAARHSTENSDKHQRYT